MDQNLADKLQTLLSPASAGEHPMLGIVIAMIVSTAASALAHVLYALFYERRETGSQIQRSFLLIGPSITLLFICVQLSLPLSLGLLGALSIVRFRVPIKEPEEVGFIMVVIASSIACATYSYNLLAILFGIILLVLVGRALAARCAGGAGRLGGLVLLSLSDEAYGKNSVAIESLLRGQVGRVRMESLTSKSNVTTVNYAFRGRAGIRWDEVKRSLAEDCAVDSVSVLFARPGGI